jgi:hypothetical protein
MTTPPLTPQSSDRPDCQRAHSVDAALLIELEHGRRTAARFLEQAGLGFAAIVRVLEGPGRRRAAGQSGRSATNS